MSPTNAKNIPVVTIVPESATHIAFVNGKTYSREEINNFTPMLKLLREIHEYGDLHTDLANKLKDLLAKLEGGK